MNSNFLSIPLAAIQESQTNPRGKWDAALINDLAESIKAHGLISAIMVRPIKGKGKIKYEIVVGSRRYRAHIVAGIKEIACEVRELSDEVAFEIQIMENLHREDIHPLDESIAFNRLREHGYTLEMIGDKIGKKKDYIITRIKLADLIEDLKEAYYAGTILLGHAAELCRLVPEDQKTCMKAILNGNGDIKYSQPIPELKSFIAANIISRLAKAPFKKEDDKLVDSAGACTFCPKRSGFNKDLFGDIQEDDRCFDHTCYQSKVDAFMTAQVARLEKKGEFRYITEQYWVWDGFPLKKKYPELLTKNNYESCEATLCRHAIAGLYVDGPQIGQTIKICINEDCEAHGDNSPTQISIDESADPATDFLEARDDARAEDEEAIQKEILNAVIQLPYYQGITGTALSPQENVVFLAAMLEILVDDGDPDEYPELAELIPSFVDSGNRTEFNILELEKLQFDKTAHNYLKRLIIAQRYFEEYCNDHQLRVQKYLTGSMPEIDHLAIRKGVLMEQEAREHAELNKFIETHGFDPTVEKAPEEEPVLPPAALNEEDPTEVKTKKSKKKGVAALLAD